MSTTNNPAAPEVLRAWNALLRVRKLMQRGRATGLDAYRAREAYWAAIASEVQPPSTLKQETQE